MFQTNRFVVAFVVSVGLGLAALGGLSSDAQAVQAANVVGTWSGTEYINGVPGSVTFTFYANGQVNFHDSAGNHNGTYSRQGSNQVTMRITSLSWTFVGHVNGNTMTGTGRDDDNGQTSTFTVTRQ